MDATKKQKVLIAGLGTLALGAGSYFLLADGPDEPKDRDVVAVVPIVKEHTPTPEPEKVTKPRRPDKPEPPSRIHREREREPRTAPEVRRRPGRRPPQPPKKTLPKAG